MNNIMVSLKEYEGDVSNLVDNEHINGHLVFDIKLSNIFPGKRFIVLMVTRMVKHIHWLTVSFCLDILW